MIRESIVAPSRHGKKDAERAKQLFVCNEAKIRGHRRRDVRVRRRGAEGAGDRVRYSGGVRGKERADARGRDGEAVRARWAEGATRRVARIRLTLGASQVGTGLPRPGCENKGAAGRYYQSQRASARGPRHT